LAQDTPPFGNNKTFAGQDGPDDGHKAASNIGGAIRFASNKRDDISTDYLRRATIRRDVVIEPLMQLGCHADVVKESRTIVDFATLALLVNERVDIPGKCIAEDAPPRSGEDASMAPIMRVLQKEQDLSLLAVGTVVPSEYYTEADARSAVKYADHMLAMITERLNPSLGIDVQKKADARFDMSFKPGAHRR
tara:strand:+ start:724 stop:1299 length:576 start_codon:yes stop_codon:yes gene_type:complete